MSIYVAGHHAISVEPDHQVATIAPAGHRPDHVAPTPMAPIPIGVRVELRNRFDDRWIRGFAVAVCGDGEFQLRRLSDGHVLPAWFPATSVRPILDT